MSTLRACLAKLLPKPPPDLMRSLLQSIINALPCADADAVVGAEWGRPTPGRAAQRNGYRHPDLDTRVGTIDVAGVPSCVTAPTSPTGCWSAGSGPSPR